MIHRWVGGGGEVDEALIALLPPIVEFDQRCAFCGIELTPKNRSEEHIWPDWIQKYVPKTSLANDHLASSTYTVTDPRTGTTLGQIERLVPGKLNKTGHTISQKLRIVCQSCNNGWMSQIVHSTKHSMTSFLVGNWPRLTPEDTTNLVRWAVLFTMVYEFAHMDTMATTADDRRRFMETKTPGDNWRVWITSVYGDGGNFLTNHIGLRDPTIAQLGPIDFPYHTAQSTAFRIGRLFVVVYSSRYAVSPMANSLGRAAGVIEIWPERNAPLHVPIISYTIQGADRFARWFVPPKATVRHSLDAQSIWSRPKR